jgi:hypothetical protein
LTVFVIFFSKDFYQWEMSNIFKYFDI